MTSSFAAPRVTTGVAAALCGSLLLLTAARPAVAARYRHPSECGSGCMVVTAYRDHGGYTDWACGGNTYGGHGGTDFGIYGGFGAVDEGRSVVAAAAGTVVQANDGEFDRCTSGNCSGGGGFGNYVALEHDDGVVTYYGHMRQGSVAVGVGDVVGCGQLLGLIASSGASTGPHLHFEPRAGGSIDPFAGECSEFGSSWVDQGGYDALPAPTCEGPANTAPRGYLDAATCDGVTGWAQDTDTPETPIAVHIYVDGEAGSGARGFALSADGHRDDLCAAIGSCAHGYAWAIPPSLRDGAAHTVFPYAIDTAGGANPLVVGAGAQFQCAPLAVPAGTLRHVTSMAVMGAWSFTHDDVTVVPSLPDHDVGATWAEAPRLVMATGTPAVFLVDGDGKKRHVPSPAAMDAWRFSYAAIEVLPVADVDAMPTGTTLPAAPFLVRVATEFAVYVVDVDVAAAPDDEAAPGDDASPGDDAAPGDDGPSGDGPADDDAAGDDDAVGDGPGDDGATDDDDGPPRVTLPARAPSCAQAPAGLPLFGVLLVLARTRRRKCTSGGRQVTGATARTT